MRKIPAIIIFILIPLAGGYLVASAQGHKQPMQTNLEFKSGSIQKTDRITLAEKGAIISITNAGVNSIQTNHPALIETIPLGTNFIGIDKQINYSVLDEFSPGGSVVKTLHNGNTGNIDTMDWFTDPAVNTSQTKIAFVSDKDKSQTNILDNALFVENLVDGSLQKIADPDPHSGGITHPVWNPANQDMITYDYYQYDTNYNPYSIIEEYNLQTHTTTPLTTQQENAYQGSFSPDGKQFIFLERGNDITTGMYIADVTENGLANVHTAATGDFAYPAFSNIPNHIYFLQAQGNNGYDLYTATITNDKLTDLSAISTGEQLQANSGYTVSTK
jgi:WD40 repeat protein